MATALGSAAVASLLVAIALDTWPANGEEFSTPAAAPPAAAAWLPEDVRMGDFLAYRDPEILQSGALMTFLDWRLALWVGELDRQTGLFHSAAGRDERIDGGISEWSFYSNGPEWGLDEAGPSIFYVKDDAGGKGQLWRAEPPWDAPAITPLTADPVLHNWLCGPTVNPALPSTRVIVYRGTPGGRETSTPGSTRPVPTSLRPSPSR